MTDKVFFVSFFFEELNSEATYLGNFLDPILRKKIQTKYIDF